MPELLLEISRQQHIQKTKSSDDYAPNNQQFGRNRYQRRTHQIVQNSVAEMNQINMNKLFKQNILDVNVRVQGETDMYLVRISFGSFLDNLHNQVMKEEGNFNRRTVIRALVNAFNGDNVYVRCSCPDFQYRQAYWLSVNGGIAGDPELRPSDETNPNDTKGSGCKHIQMVLSNNVWLSKVASVIYNYVNYMKTYKEALYSQIIYPAIFEKEYTEPVQMDLFDKDELSSTEDEIDISNKWAKTKNQIQPGWNDANKENPEDKEIEGQKHFNLDSLISD